MNHLKIVSALKTHPKLSIAEIAKRLKLPTLEVSKAQHEHLKVWMAPNRSSTAWEMKQYNHQKQTV